MLIEAHKGADQTRIRGRLVTTVPESEGGVVGTRCDHVLPTTPEAPMEHMHNCPSRLSQFRDPVAGCVLHATRSGKRRLSKTKEREDE